MDVHSTSSVTPIVHLAGDVGHADFRDVVTLLHAEVQLTTVDAISPELVVVAQARPGAVSAHTVAELQRQFPLAGVVALLGSWCEGEARTGRPWPGIKRLYWYEFPAWWARQLAQRAIGACPEWSRPADCASIATSTHEGAKGLVLIHTASHDTAESIGDVLIRAGYATVWQPPGRPSPIARGAAAAIWDGGQLSDDEKTKLSAFCRRFTHHATPVIAMLGFPRRDSIESARAVGVAAVLGKPWCNANLVTTIEGFVQHNAYNSTNARAA